MPPHPDTPADRLRAALNVADHLENDLRKLARADVDRDHPTLRSRTARCLLHGHQRADPVEDLDPLSRSERAQLAGDGNHLPSLAHVMHGRIDELRTHLSPHLDHSEGRNSITADVRRQVRARDDHCRLCKSQLPPNRTTSSAETRPRERPGYVHDHIIPSYHGGPGDAWNVWRLCVPCDRCKNRHLHIPPKGIRLAVRWLADELGIELPRT